MNTREVLRLGLWFAWIAAALSLAEGSFLIFGVPPMPYPFNSHFAIPPTGGAALMGAIASIGYVVWSSRTRVRVSIGVSAFLINAATASRPCKINLSAAAGMGVVGGVDLGDPNVINGFVGGSWAVGINSDGQFFAQGGGFVSRGYGAYFGVGPQANLGVSNPLPPGWTTQNFVQGDLNAGIGRAAGASLQLPRDPADGGFAVSTGFRPSIGVGVQASVGIGFQNTWASNPLIDVRAVQAALVTALNSLPPAIRQSLCGS